MQSLYADENMANSGSGIQARRDKRALGDISNVVGGGGANAPTSRRQLTKAAPVAPSRKSTSGLAGLKQQPLQGGEEAVRLEQQQEQQQQQIPQEIENLLPRRVPAYVNRRTLDPAVVRDVDVEDDGNPLAVVGLVNDIFTHFRSRETRFVANPAYMASQRDVNEKMRAILVDWLVDVHLKFKLVPEVLYLTVNLIDRFLSQRSVARQKLQLVGVTAMLIASKYEEIYAPETRDFVYISDRAYTREEILKMEAVVLSVLKFDLTIPSPLKFLDRALKVAGASRQEHLYADFCLELAQVDFRMVRFPPSMLAAACVNVAGRVFARWEWDATLEVYTGYTEEDLLECCDEIVDLIHRSESSNLTAVRRKYSSSKYLEIAKTPVDMLMDFE